MISRVVHATFVYVKAKLSLGWLFLAGDFSQENDKLNDKQEMMDDALDGLFDDDEIEEEADAVTQQARSCTISPCLHEYVCGHIRMLDVSKHASVERSARLLRLSWYCHRIACSALNGLDKVSASRCLDARTWQSHSRPAPARSLMIVIAASFSVHACLSVCLCVRMHACACVRRTHVCPYYLDASINQHALPSYTCMYICVRMCMHDSYA
jgi:hypothetical protein